MSPVLNNNSPVIDVMSNLRRLTVAFCTRDIFRKITNQARQPFPSAIQFSKKKLCVNVNLEGVDEPLCFVCVGLIGDKPKRDKNQLRFTTSAWTLVRDLRSPTDVIGQIMA